MGKVAGVKIKLPGSIGTIDQQRNVVYASEPPAIQKKKAQTACDDFNSTYKVGDIIQMWHGTSEWNSDFGIIKEAAVPKEVDVETDDTYRNDIEYNGIFVLSLIGGNSDYRDKNGFRECRIMNTKWDYKKVTFDDIVEFRKKAWTESLDNSIHNLKMAKESVRRYKRLLNYNERNLENDIEKAKQRVK